MSDIGLYAGIYEQLLFYANKMDYALVNLKSDNDDLVKGAREELAAFLKELVKKDVKKPGIRLIETVLSQQLPPSFVDKKKVFQELGEILEKRMPKKAEMGKLEEIAFAIDRECSHTSQRLRGSL